MGFGDNDTSARRGLETKLGLVLIVLHFKNLMFPARLHANANSISEKRFGVTPSTVRICRVRWA
jgi:hypothetical protein